MRAVRACAMAPPSPCFCRSATPLMFMPLSAAFPVAPPDCCLLAHFLILPFDTRCDRYCRCRFLRFAALLIDYEPYALLYAFICFHAAIVDAVKMITRPPIVLAADHAFSSPASPSPDYRLLRPRYVILQPPPTIYLLPDQAPLRASKLFSLFYFTLRHAADATASAAAVD